MATVPTPEAPALHQHRVPRLQLSAGLQQVVGGQKDDGHAAGLHRVDGLRVGEDEVGVHRDVLGLASGPHGHDALANGDAFHLRAYLGDGTGGLQPQRSGQVRPGVAAAPAHQVGVVHPGGIDFDQHLVGPWLPIGTVLPLQHVQAAEFVNAD